MNLSGKDFFDTAEAAHYSCVSVRQFEIKATDLGIKSGKFMGKKVYRRIDIQKVMSEAWQQSNGEEQKKTLHTSAGTTTANKLKSALAKSKSSKLNK